MKTLHPIRYTLGNPVHDFIQRRPEIKEEYERTALEILKPEKVVGLVIPENETFNQPIPELGKDYILTSVIDYNQGIIYHEPNSFDEGLEEAVAERVMSNIQKHVETKPEALQVVFAWKGRVYEGAAQNARLVQMTAMLTGQTVEQIHQAADKEMPKMMRAAMAHHN